MKNIHIKISLLLISVMSLISGTGMAVDFPQEGDMTNGAKAWSDNCMRCHNMRTATELRDDQWIITAFHMRVRGGLTGQETRDILTFLQKTN